MAAWTRELRDLGADEIASRLGGRKDGEWWRLPYLCKGERELKSNGDSGFAMTSHKGWINAHCHHCELPSKDLTKLIYEAAVGSIPSQPTTESRGRVNGDAAKAKTATEVALEIGDDCVFYGPENSGIEVVNGWPLPLRCDGDCYAGLGYVYDDFLKQVIARFGGVQFTCQYRNADGQILESVRQEPGKQIWGKGSNAKLNPLPLLWPAGNKESGMAVIVEGEKAAAGLRSHGHNAISWRGGKAAWKHTDWDHADAVWRSFDRVILWPDWEQGSTDAFYQLGKHLAGLRDDFELTIVDLPTDITDKGSADAADFAASEVIHIPTNCTREFAGWSSGYTPASPAVATRDDDDDDGSSDVVPDLYRRGGYYDIARMLKYLHDDLAYIQAPADRGLDESLAIADGAGYWRLLHEERNKARLLAAIRAGRQSALQALLSDRSDDVDGWSDRTRQRVTEYLGTWPTHRDRLEATDNLTTRLRESELGPVSEFRALPKYNLEHRRIAATDGILTFREQAIALPSQRILSREEVRDYGLVFDEGWSDLHWEDGAYEADTPEAEAVRTLIANLGDFPLVVAEMLAGLDRRIAILHSKTSGVGKSMFTGLLKTALGSLVETGQPGELTKKSMGNQFPTLNNHLTRCRVLVIPEVNTAGLENINFGKLVHLTGETHLTTERKYMENTTLPRTGNILLTMGEVQKEDAKEQKAVKWHEIQGLFNEDRSDGRLRVWDIDAAGGVAIGDRHFAEAMKPQGQLAFVDWLVGTMHSGKPNTQTPAVLDHINNLFNTSRESPTQSDHYSPQLDKADAVIRRMTEWTECWDHLIDVCDLAMIVEGKLETETWEDAKVRMTDQGWLSSIRRVYDLPGMKKLVVEDRPNGLTKDRNGRRNLPVRGIRFKGADEYDPE